MNIAADIKAAESFAKALEGVDPAKLVDTALKFMSSTRTRIESGEKRIADLETKLGTALSTIDKLSIVLGGTAGIDFSAFETEIAAMGKTAAAEGSDTKAADPVATVQAAVPDADPAHVQAAVDAHAAAVTSGTDPVQAATVAATNAGATADAASAIAAAIPAPAAPTSTDTTAQTGGLPGALPASV